MSGGWGSSFGDKDMTIKIPSTKAERDKKKQEALAIISRKFEDVYRILKDVEKIADDAQVSVYFRGTGYGSGATYYPHVKEDTERRAALEKLTEEERALLGLPVDLSEVFELDENDWDPSDEGQWVSSSAGGC